MGPEALACKNHCYQNTPISSPFITPSRIYEHEELVRGEKSLRTPHLPIAFGYHSSPKKKWLRMAVMNAIDKDETANH